MIPKNLPEAIAQGLARDGWFVADHFLSSDEVDKLLSHFGRLQEEGTWKQAGIGQDKAASINKGIRGDEIVWIDPEDQQISPRFYLDKIADLVQHLNRTCFLGIKGQELHFTRYPPGSFYLRHLDQFKGTDHRRLSVVCYLNPDWVPESGGELVLYLAEGEEKIQPLAGRFVIFQSDVFEHEVLPTTQTRRSITGWLLDTAPGLSFLR